MQVGSLAWARTPTTSVQVPTVSVCPRLPIGAYASSKGAPRSVMSVGRRDGQRTARSTARSRRSAGRAPQRRRHGARRPRRRNADKRSAPSLRSHRHRLYVRAPHAKTLAPDRAELFSDDLPAMSARPSPSPSEHSRRVLQQQCADRGFSAKAPRGVPILGHICASSRLLGTIPARAGISSYQGAHARE